MLGVYLGAMELQHGRVLELFVASVRGDFDVRRRGQFWWRWVMSKENRFWVDEEEWEHADRMMVGIMGDDIVPLYAEPGSADSGQEEVVFHEGASNFLYRRYDR